MTTPLQTRIAASTTQRLFKAARLLNDRALARVREATGLPVRPAHTALLPHLPLAGGIRQTALAERLGITKQAVGQRVDELVAMGLLERRPDPHDGRARVVAYTATGLAVMAQALGVLESVDAEVAAWLGGDGALAEALGRLLTHLDAP